MATAGLWIWFKEAPRRWERSPRFFSASVGVTSSRLRIARRAVRQKFEEWLKKNGGTTFGFVPRTFAASVGRDMGFPVQSFDGIMLTYALYMDVKVAEGTWEEEPVVWERMKGFIHDDWDRR